jgi:RNA polymerase primary sigma factor
MHNLRLVHKLAWDQPARGIPKRDLVQEGIVGLIRAAEKYDFSRGFRFTTYAYSWINQHLQRATENRGSLINYPAHVVREINQLHRTRMTLQEKTGHDPGVQLLAEQTGFENSAISRSPSIMVMQRKMTCESRPILPTRTPDAPWKN